MKGRGEAHGAVTIVNAIAAGKGCAVGIDLRTWAEVELASGEGVEVRLEGLPDEPVKLVELCVQTVLDHFSVKKKAMVRTGSQIPVSRGLKSSSAAANAVILATLNALQSELPADDVLRMNADVSIRAGVSVTGAMDDAAASLLGGVVFTDNHARTLLRRERFDLCDRVIITVPERMIRKSGLPKERIALYRPLAEEAFRLAWNGEYIKAMTLNSLIYGAALGLDQELSIKALRAGSVASGISGTGPSVVSFVDALTERQVAEAMGKDTLIAKVYQGVH
ncbi:MAG: Shikimate kinase [Methanomassiliicoccales archaeon PtaB.Bin215]|nr:MAG: Shikimate kinase [Methanomassiliicoccales archaeon PtaB.Bin215]